jgi:hypothetical protein
MVVLLRRRGIESIRHAALPNPVVAWGLNEGAGSTSTDLSGNGHTATVAGWATGHNSAFGSGNAKYIGSLIPSPTAWCLMAWANPLTNNSGDTVFALASDEPGNSWWFEVDWADSAHLQIDIQAPGHGQQTSVASVTTAKQGTDGVPAWTHIAMSWTAATNLVTLSLNATSVATLTASAAFTAPGYLTAGSWDYYGNVNATGVDDVRLLNVVPTSAQLTSFMNTPL